MNEQIDPMDNPVALQEDLLGLPVSEAQSYPEATVRIRAKKKWITTLTLTSATCRWPFGDPAAPDFHYCGKIPQTDRPYCDAHDALSRQSGTRKRPAA